VSAGSPAQLDRLALEEPPPFERSGLGFDHHHGSRFGASHPVCRQSIHPYDGSLGVDVGNVERETHAERVDPLGVLDDKGPFETSAADETLEATTKPIGHLGRCQHGCPAHDPRHPGRRQRVVDGTGHISIQAQPEGACGTAALPRLLLPADLRGWAVVWALASVYCLCTVDAMSELDAELLRRVRIAAIRVAEAERALTVAKADFALAVRMLNLAGGSVRSIAKAVGVSHQRIAQLIDSAEDGRGWKRRSKSGVLLQCSFCNRHQSDVLKLIAGPGVYICNICVDSAQTVARGEGESGVVAPVGLPLMVVVVSPAGMCSFCGKAPRPDLSVVTDGASSICTECLALCDEIIAETGLDDT
jgi:ClpX C4-type zinc finger